MSNLDMYCTIIASVYTNYPWCATNTMVCCVPLADTDVLTVLTLRDLCHCEHH